MIPVATRPPQRNLSALTGLRFIAAIAVVLYHFDKVPLPSWASPIQAIVDSGYVGVSLFFLLSGFIMAYSYLSPADGQLRGTKRAFYVSRFARIAPAYVLAFLLAAPTDIHLSLHVNGVRTGVVKLLISAFAVLTFTQAWTPMTAWAWNFPAWSVSVEAFFYAVFPWLGPRLFRSKSSFLKAAGSLWLISLFAPLALYLFRGPTGPPRVGDYLKMAVEFTPLLRLPEFAIGILLGRAFVTGVFDRLAGTWFIAVSALSVLVAMGLSSYVPHALVASFLFTPLFAALIVSLGLGKGPLAAVLSSRPLVLLGEASYGIYILQIPVSYVLRRPPPHTSAVVLFGYSVALILTALASFHFLETPLRIYIRRRFSGPERSTAPSGPPTPLCAPDQVASATASVDQPSRHPVETPQKKSRRQVILAAASAAGVVAVYPAARLWRGARLEHSLLPEDVLWMVTTESSPWQVNGIQTSEPFWHAHDFVVHRDQPDQVIDGFGGCFNELGWTALAALRPSDQQSVFRELFSPGVGANFSICRTPLGANDFSRGWYSYDETPDDFSLEHFSIENDLQTLVPFIKAAQEHNQGLRLWTSPWSPPSWMKKNDFYAERPQPSDDPPNGIRPEQVGENGSDMFRPEERYYQAYAGYFAKYLDAYRQHGIEIGMVMPQNEFNSAQPFPSCTWKPESLARLVRYLGPLMDQRGVAIFLGTLEVADPTLLDAALQDEQVSRYIRGLGVQWAGKGALPALHATHPHLQIYQTEQECGDGLNDWRHCLHCWDLMKFNFENGANAYMYWNLALSTEGESHWGWKQNSLITVDLANRSYRFNHEYYLMKHFSHFIQPGAQRLNAQGRFVEGLAFRNPDESIVVILLNRLNFRRPVNVTVGDARVSGWLKANSFNTLFIKAASRESARKLN